MCCWPNENGWWNGDINLDKNWDIQWISNKQVSWGYKLGQTIGNIKPTSTMGYKLGQAIGIYIYIEY